MVGLLNLLVITSYHRSEDRLVIVKPQFRSLVDNHKYIKHFIYHTYPLHPQTHHVRVCSVDDIDM